MNVERIDPEILAAFLEGRLEPAERDRVLRVIAAHPEEYDVFADAVRVQAELASAGGAEVVPIATRQRSSGWLVAIPALIAAGIAAVVVLPGIGKGDLSPVGLAERLRVVDAPGDGSVARNLGPTWDQPGWSVVRGTASELPGPAREFRLGSRSVDLEVAARAVDSTALALVGAELVVLLAGEPGGAAVAQQYRDALAASPAASTSARKQAAEALWTLTNESFWFALGGVVEAARIYVLASETGNRSAATQLHRAVGALIDKAGSSGGTEQLALIPVLTRTAELIASDDGARRAELLILLRDLTVRAGR